MTITQLEHEQAFTLAADPERVFRALTAPAELERWFAERVEVDLRVGGAYRFWGRHTLGAPGAADADQVITALEPPHVLAFRWRVEDCPSVVTLRLAPQTKDGAAATGLTVRHVVSGTLPGARGVELVDDLWKLTMGNLAAHLAGGDGILRPDFTEPRPEIRVSILIDAPPAAVWRALIEPELMNRWIASAAEVDPRVGGRYGFGWNYEIDGRSVSGGPTTILELVPNEKLVLDWPDWRGDDSVPKQSVAWHLAPEGGGTRVTLVHAGFSRAADISDYPFGWGGFLGRLKAAVETEPTTANN